MMSRRDTEPDVTVDANNDVHTTRQRVEKLFGSAEGTTTS
jgi:hypothetical protein